MHLHAPPLDFLRSSNVANGGPNLFFTTTETDITKRTYICAVCTRGRAHCERDMGLYYGSLHVYQDHSHSTSLREIL